MIQIILIILSGCFFSWGGHSFLLARRLFMPVILTASCFYITHSWWSLTMMASYGCLTLGYGDNSPLRHIFGQCWGRGIWGILVSLALSLGLFMTGNIALWLFISYLIACFFAEPLLKNLWQVAGDFLIGCVFGSIVLIVHQ